VVVVEVEVTIETRIDWTSWLTKGLKGMPHPGTERTAWTRRKERKEQGDGKGKDRDNTQRHEQYT